MGFNIDSLTMNETIDKIEEHIREKKICQHVVLNAAKVVATRYDKKLKEIINNCEIINADGQSIVWAANFLGSPLPERVTGIDLMMEIIKISSRKGYRIYFFGATEEVNKKVVDKFRSKYPNLQIAGRRNGYFTEEENSLIIEDMKNSNADILLVAFSSPKKEYWINKNIDKINIPFVMGVGGSFDVVAGVTKRAPLWMQKMGLEWFYRFIQEPKRMWKRVLIGNSKFIYYVFKEKIKI